MRIFQDLDMNDNRITSLGAPKASADAATKRWVNQQLKDGMADVDEIETEIEQIRATLGQPQKDFEGLAKTVQAKEDKSKCFATNGGKVSGDLDMQNFRIRIFPEAKAADEPITKDWYSKDFIDAVLSFRQEITDLESKTKGQLSDLESKIKAQPAPEDKMQGDQPIDSRRRKIDAIREAIGAEDRMLESLSHGRRRP